MQRSTSYHIRARARARPRAGNAVAVTRDAWSTTGGAWSTTGGAWSMRGGSNEAAARRGWVKGAPGLTGGAGDGRLVTGVPGRAPPKEATLEPIVQMSQDLARGEYAKGTRAEYLRTVRALQARFARPLAELSREEVRTFVDEVLAERRSSSSRRMALSAVVFLYRRTLGMPQHVSFNVSRGAKYPKLQRPQRELNPCYRRERPVS